MRFRGSAWIHSHSCSHGPGCNNRVSPSSCFLIWIKPFAPFVSSCILKTDRMCYLFLALQAYSYLSSTHQLPLFYHSKPNYYNFKALYDYGSPTDHLFFCISSVPVMVAPIPPQPNLPASIFMLFKRLPLMLQSRFPQSLHNHYFTFLQLLSWNLPMLWSRQRT